MWDDVDEDGQSSVMRISPAAGYEEWKLQRLPKDGFVKELDPLDQKRGAVSVLKDQGLEISFGFSFMQSWSISHRQRNQPFWLKWWTIDWGFLLPSALRSWVRMSVVSDYGPETFPQLLWLQFCKSEATERYDHRAWSCHVCGLCALL